MKGSIDEYKPGCWRVRIYFNGQRIQVYRGKDGKVFEGPKGAISAQAEISRQIEEKEFVPREWHKPQVFLLKNAFEEFTKTKVCQIETKIQRDNRFNKHILPVLGDMDMREIRTVHINRLHGLLIDKKLKPNTIKGIFRVLKATFNYNNITHKDLRWPKVEVPHEPIAWLTANQQEAVFKYLNQIDLPIFMFMQITGCRPSEACALQRGDIDSEKGTITIQRSMGNKKRLIPTKNKMIRVIPIGIFSSPQILRPTSATGFVFYRNIGPYTEQKLRRLWQKANKQAHKELGIPIIKCYNAFRHSMASQLVNAGVPIEAISKMLGHSDTGTTEKFYAEILPEVAWGYRKVVTLPVRQEKKTD